jgi:membrane-bound serine protease (ClpP class)
MALGAVMLINSPYPEMQIHWPTAIAVTLPFSVITVFLVSLAVRARRSKVETGPEGMIGEIGAALTELAPRGKVFVRGEYWDAVSTRPVPVGAPVRVTAVEKLKLAVEPVPDPYGG